MSLKELFAIANTKGNYLINYIKDGWLRSVIFCAKNPTQLMYLWNEFAMKSEISLDSITVIERV